jgi:hypothetical protein
LPSDLAHVTRLGGLLTIINLAVSVCEDLLRGRAVGNTRGAIDHQIATSWLLKNYDDALRMKPTSPSQMRSAHHSMRAAKDGNNILQEEGE